MSVSPEVKLRTDSERSRFQTPLTVLFFLGLLLLIGLSACGQSPLLHHVNADGIRAAEAPRAPAATADPRTVDPTAAIPPAGAEFAPAVTPCLFEFKRENFCAGLEWVTQPNLRSRTDGTFTLRTWAGTTSNSDGNFAAPNGTAVRGFLFMKSMGHGTDEDFEITASAPGIYSVDRIYPVMRGDWQIHLELKEGEAVLDEAELCCHFDGQALTCPTACS